jgi:hypothetical protein
MNGNAQGYAAPGKQIAERSHICQDGIGHVEHDLKWPKAE